MAFLGRFFFPAMGAEPPPLFKQLVTNISRFSPQIPVIISARFPKVEAHPLQNHGSAPENCHIFIQIEG